MALPADGGVGSVAPFQGKVALVTGAASGIGRACALALARRGATVVVADVAAEAGGQTAQLVEGIGGSSLYLRCDVTRSDQVCSTVDALLESYGRLDMACNSAGTEGLQARTIDYPDEVWDQVLATNLRGVWYCMKYEIPPMLRQGRGAIVNVASILGLVGLPGYAAYVAAKHGVIGLTRTAALEHAADGIRVNAVCPGYTMTPMLEREGVRRGSDAYERHASQHPAGRLAEADEIAEAVAWLCSEAASFITGHAMAVDGGYTAR